MLLWLRPSRAITRLECLVVFPLIMQNAPLPVEQSCLVVISVPEYAMTAGRKDHMKYANIHAAEFWFVPTAVKQSAVCLVHHATGNAVDAALM